MLPGYQSRDLVTKYLLMLPGYQVFMNAPWLPSIYECSLVTKYLYILTGY